MKTLIYKPLLMLWVMIPFLVTGQTDEKVTNTMVPNLSIDYEYYELDNGLKVVLHIDKSDPIVAVAIQYGVGSSREVLGKTGFAHLFEHMLFQESEHVPQDQFFKTIQDAGGSLNGGTVQDGTIYYETVPKNALETVLWMESDRMGYFINTVTQSSFVNQQEVVQNEKRMGVDNTPYGHTSYVIAKNIFPEGHPYSWPVLGELEDLKKATLKDVKEFYNKFYGPNNATLVIAGDFDVSQVKVMIEKYFGEIKKHGTNKRLKPQNVTINKVKRLYHEDNFATAPQLNMVWPTVEQYSKDSYALDFLSEILSNGKKSPLYQILVKNRKLTSAIGAQSNSGQIAGTFGIKITANDGVDLDRVEVAITDALKVFEETGITDAAVEGIKARLETAFYAGYMGVMGKAYALARYTDYTGDPGFFKKDLEHTMAITKEDVMAAYNKYVKDKPYVVTSFVPKGKLELAVSGSQKAAIVEEEITENVQTAIMDSANEVKKTPSKIDRSNAPEIGEAPPLKMPEIWAAGLDNGMKVYGIEKDELPIVNFSIVLDGGHLFDPEDKNGMANLFSNMMMQGTANKTPEELEKEIEHLGASITMNTHDESILMMVSTLKRNFSKTMALVQEVLMEPRWDREAFNRIATRIKNSIKQSGSKPDVIANSVYKKVLYGKDHPFARPINGTEETIDNITLADLKEFYNKNLSPSEARLHIVGAVSQSEVFSALDGFVAWKMKEVDIPSFNTKNTRDKSTLYFVDVPNAKQSVIKIGYVAMSRTSADFYPAEVMNYNLGGNFSSRVNLILREEKGYAYYAETGFSKSRMPGTFTASTSVRTNTTKESVEILRDQISRYKDGISQEALIFTKNALINSNARRFETNYALLRMLQEISTYNLDFKYIEREESITNQMTLKRHKELINKYLDTSTMAYLVVGDANTQFQQFKHMGFDDVKLLDKKGNEIILKEVTKSSTNK
ncbi:pitrilysin family protein [Flavivirga sp. 57AJ16]|uniref:M16 family metallopeptidase n=1 Tax=Flavivirga sp. 57AJ16 TaxID=3025307 RepID=UPI002366DF8E|nr:pitrilysin family protein [Flavivirga sp. 57AJ16]MDD7885253.1 pitrilysin family protein [Flavivirga sp. 57AJ16]